MKQMNVWQRLNRSWMLLILLLLAGVGIAFWVASARASYESRRDRLSGAKDRLYRDMLLMGDSLRTLSADSRNDLERKHFRDSEASFRSDLETLQHAANNELPELAVPLRALSDFAFERAPKTFGFFQGRVLEMVDSDPASALSYFNSNYAAVAAQRDQFFRDLTQQIEQAVSSDVSRAQAVTAVGSVCLVLILLASLLVGRLQTAALSVPLRRLTDTLERIRQGDLTQRLPGENSDEFGLIGQGLNRVADELCELINQVQRSGVQVNTTATDIASTAREQQASSSEIASGASRIGTTTKQIAVTSKELAKSLSEANQVADQTTSLAASGQASIARMESSMRELMEASGTISAKLATLNEKTDRINSVVTAITKVADQTNLLSLNAAIEAEKAGEYGLGFAVVAMEIRRLADQTAVATYDIEKMVKEMQSAVASGNLGMENFSEEVRRGVEDLQQTGGQLAQIVRHTQTLAPHFQLVSEGIHAQASGAQEINETLSRLSDAARQAAESLRDSDQAVEQLNGAARRLQTSVARFKLGNAAGVASASGRPGSGI
jgi:methyl-accepting chemotaxis protein WspA